MPETPTQPAAPTRTSRVPIALVLLLDAALAVAVARLPSRLVLPPLRENVPPAAPSFAAFTPDQALFVVTAPRPGSDTLLVRVPLAPGRAAPAPERLGADFALLEPVRGLDAVMPTGARWAWNGRTLLFAAPSRRLGAHRVYVALVGSAQGRLLPTREIDGTRPSAGWARDHFEVAYITPAPPPDAGRVQWVVDIDEQGGAARERIVEGTGVAHTPLAWPGGVRAASEGAAPGQLMLPDGTRVDIPRGPSRDSPRARPFFALARDGAVAAGFATADIVAGSELSGDYTARVRVGEITVEAHQGARVARPRLTVTRAGRRATFETSVEARWRDVIAHEQQGVLHVVDPRGFHVRLAAADLAPLDPRTSRLGHLAGALGGSMLAFVVCALAAAHALAFVVERASRRPGRSARATFAGLLAVLLAGAAVALVWYAV